MELPVSAGCLSPAIPGEQLIPEKTAALAVIRRNNGITIDVFREISPELLPVLVMALAHAL